MGKIQLDFHWNLYNKICSIVWIINLLTFEQKVDDIPCRKPSFVTIYSRVEEQKKIAPANAVTFRKVRDAVNKTKEQKAATSSKDLACFKTVWILKDSKLQELNTDQIFELK